MGLKHDYFIIESLMESDVKDGKLFNDTIKTLRRYDHVSESFTGKYDPVYKPVKTITEFERALIEFSNSDYKYLFVSAHGTDMEIVLAEEIFHETDLEVLDIDLKKRRIFMSTCKGGTRLFAKHFIKKGAYSVIGSPDRIPQIVAAGMWPTRAWIFEGLNEDSLNFDELDETLELSTKIYQINLAYYSFIREEPKMKEYLYSPDTKRKRTDYLI